MSRVGKVWSTLRSHAPPLLIILVVIAGGVWTFVRLADLLEAGTLHTFDKNILLAFRASDDLTDPLGPAWVEILVRDITALGGTAVLSLVTLAVTGYLLLARRARTALFVVVAVASGALLNVWLKASIGRPRPALVPGMGPTYSASFPSGHTMMSTITYLTLAVLLARTQARRRMRAYLIAIATLLSLLIGISRVYLAVHWPSDVLAGWAVGAGWAILGWVALRWLQQRGAAEASSGV